MTHDLAILIGLFAWMGKTFDGVFLAALLTVIGYSVNDSVVIFDRIREQTRLRPDDPIAEVANDACLQTVPRTINTGLGALMILLSLFFLGGDTLSDFALALLIGILVGTYSSVFTASPIAIFFEERFPRPPPEPEPKVPVGRSRSRT
jgi:SecD/SecF fusion protein